MTQTVSEGNTYKHPIEKLVKQRLKRVKKIFKLDTKTIKEMEAKIQHQFDKIALHMPKYSSQVDQLEMLKIINWVRMYPGEAASWIDTIYRDQKASKEGVKIWKEKGMAHKEVIHRLKHTQPMKPLLEELAVDIISYNHAKYMGIISKILNHNESKNNGDVYSRIKKYGKFKAVNENLAFERAGNLRHVL